MFVNPDKLVTALGHLIQNAQESTQPIAPVVVAGYSIAKVGRIEVSDSGLGTGQNCFRGSRSLAFDGTGGNAGITIGAHQIRQTVFEPGSRPRLSSRSGVNPNRPFRLPRIMGGTDASPRMAVPGGAS